MSLRCMPFLILNLGGEMIYILQQRLRAQNVEQKKAVLVLHEVIEAILSEKFFTELMKEKEMYNVEQTKQIMIKLAHASIMKLNQNSMTKLLELISVSFKLQLLSMEDPTELLQITLRHMNSLKEILIETGKDCQPIENAIKAIVELCNSFSTFEFEIVTQNLLDFFQDKFTKVSLFIDAGLQKANGHFYYDPKTIPINCLIPGTIKTAEGIKNGEHPHKRAKKSTSVHMNNAILCSENGINMFTEDIKKQIEDKKAKETAPQTPQDLKSPTSPSNNSSSSFESSISSSETTINSSISLKSTLSSTATSTASAVLSTMGNNPKNIELNYLASLITPSNNSKKQQSLKLDFPDSTEDGEIVVEKESTKLLVFGEKKKPQQHKAALQEKIFGKEYDNSSNARVEEEDLFDLL